MPIRDVLNRAPKIEGPFRIESWDIDIYVRNPTLGQTDEINRLDSDSMKSVEMIIACVCEANGSPAFGPDDRKKLCDQPTEVVGEVAEAIGKVLSPGN